VKRHAATQLLVPFQMDRSIYSLHVVKHEKTSTDTDVCPTVIINWTRVYRQLGLLYRYP